MPEQDDDALDAAGRAKRKEKVPTKSISQIGSELQTSLVVEGSVTKAGDSVRVVVQLASSIARWR